MRYRKPSNPISLGISTRLVRDELVEETRQRRLPARQKATSKESQATMETVIAAFSLAAFLACVAVIAMTLGYNVELMFHPPIFIKLKLTRTRQTEGQQSRSPARRSQSLSSRRYRRKKDRLVMKKCPFSPITKMDYIVR